MERHIKKHQVFSWSHAYLDYKSIKAWLGKEYPFGCWYLDPASSAEGPFPGASAPEVDVHHSRHHVRSLSGVEDIVGGSTLLGAEVVSPLSAHASSLAGNGPRRPLEVACYVAFEGHHNRPASSPSPQSEAATPTGYDHPLHYGDHRRRPPETLWPNVIEVHYPQQLMYVSSSLPPSPPHTSAGEAALLSPNAPSPRSRAGEGHRVCIPSRTFYARNPFPVCNAANHEGCTVSGDQDTVPSPIVLIGCDTLNSHLQRAPMDENVLMHIRDVSHRNIAFMQRVEQECAKVEKFYLNQTRAWSKVLMRLVDRAHVLLTEVHLLTSSPRLTGETPHHQPDATDDDNERREHLQEILIKQLEATEVALQRIYFAYTLLARFLVQNTEAVHHLMRKVETRSQQYLDAHTVALENKYSFMVRRGDNSHPVGALLDWVEREYIILIGGDKKCAARELHVAEDDAEAQDVLAGARVWTGITVGILAGITVTCIVMVFLEVQLVYEASVPITTFSGVSTSTAAVLMALTGLAAFFAALFAINIVVWDAFGVHYAFIFELDDRFHWDGLCIFRYSMRYVASWSVGMLTYVYTGRFASTDEAPKYVPYAVLGVFGLLLVYDLWIFQTASTLFKVVPMVPRRVARESRAARRAADAFVKCCQKFWKPSKETSFSPSSPNGGSPANVSELNTMLRHGRNERRETFLSQDWSRSWLGRTMWRILTAPYFQVSFSDFYFADQLTSLTGFFGQVQVILTTAIWGTGNKYPILAALPHVWRLLQCLRRFWDQPSLRAPVAPAELATTPNAAPSASHVSHEPANETTQSQRPFWLTMAFWHPNLTNALKYLSGIVQIVVSWRFDIAYTQEKNRVKGLGPGAVIDWTSGTVSVLLAFWILTAAIEYIFKLGWDVYMDAGFLRIGVNKKNIWGSFLRPKLIYPVYTYWVFVIIDVVLRFSVFIRIMLIVRDYDFNHVNPVFWWGLEVFRRFVWNFFRVENEQINNMENYRAVDVVPPVWAAAEEAVLKHNRGTITVSDSSDLDEEDLEAFGALWGSSSSERDLPSPAELFRRLPISNQQSALFGFALQQRWTTDAAAKFWHTNEEGLLCAFDAQNVEHQTRIVFLAVGDTPFAQFLQTHRHQRSRGSSLLRRRRLENAASGGASSEGHELLRMPGGSSEEPAFVISVT